MADRRKGIREAVVGYLLSETDAGVRVYNGRVIPWDKAELPLLNVITMAESIDSTASGYGNGRRIRSIEVGVICVVAADPGDEILNVLDDLVQQVEDVLNIQAKLGGLVTSFELTSTDAPEVDKDSSRPFAFTTAHYNAIYVES